MERSAITNTDFELEHRSLTVLDTEASTLIEPEDVPGGAVLVGDTKPSGGGCSILCVVELDVPEEQGRFVVV